MSVDGYIDDATPERLVLSGPEDLDRVDEVRADVDAILVGAGTVRADDPRLLLRSPERRAARVARGVAETPRRVVLSASGGVPADARLFTYVDDPAAEPPLVYTASGVAPGLRAALGGTAEVVAAGAEVTVPAVLADLADRGVERLLVEGGTAVHTLFLEADAVDEIHVAVAPFLVGDPAAPRFVGPGTFPQSSGRRMRLADIRAVGDIALLVYLA